MSRLFPPEELFMVALFMGVGIASLIVIMRAMAKAASKIDKKKAALGAAKIIGGTILKVAWKDYKSSHKY